MFRPNGATMTIAAKNVLRMHHNSPTTKSKGEDNARVSSKNNTVITADTNILFFFDREFIHWTDLTNSFYKSFSF